MSLQAPDLMPLNPTTPMAFVPPQLAKQITFAVYVIVGTCAVLIWDILDNVRLDWKLATRRQIRLTTFVYFLSRLGALGFVLSGALFQTAPLGNCPHFQHVVGVFYPITIPATSFLFFWRLKAVYSQNRPVISIFAALWLSVLATCLLVPFGLEGVNIGLTRYCVTASLDRFIAGAGITSLVNDTLVYLAISYKLMLNSHSEKGFKTMMFGDYLPAFSRTLLMDGQAYYLAMVATNLPTVIMFYLRAVPPTYRTMFSVPNLALMNIMACRVFRNTKFGVFNADSISTTMVGTKGAKRNTIIPRALTFRTADDDDNTDNGKHPQLKVHIDTIVERVEEV
ncbi:hypothetical protein BJ165DRAFT_1611317 [Panaeolus papilionaceus]|nr:hypothetical protein BJ165DRAFT_1611317 [Panaeolus papilionaceus]